MESEGEFAGFSTAEWVAALRANCRAQLDSWRQIPWLALQAADPDEETVALAANGTWQAADPDGPSYSQDVLGLAFADGYWPVGLDDSQTMFSAYVDCATGEIMDAEDPTRVAPDEAVEFLLHMPIEVNGDAIARQLERAIAARAAPDVHAAWRSAMARKFHVSMRPFTRAAGPEVGLG